MLRAGEWEPGRPTLQPCLAVSRAQASSRELSVVVVLVERLFLHVGFCLLFLSLFSSPFSPPSPCLETAEL